MNGSGFVNGSTLFWNKHRLNTQFFSANQVTATVPTAVNSLLLAYPGAAQISVVNPDNSRGDAFLTINAPLPGLTRLTPDSGQAGSSGAQFRVIGSNFTSDATVYLGNAPLPTTFHSSADLTALIPANLLLAPGVSPVTVLQQGGASNALNYTVNPTSQPILTVGALTRDADNNILVSLTLTNTTDRNAQRGGDQRGEAAGSADDNRVADRSRGPGKR